MRDSGLVLGLVAVALLAASARRITPPGQPEPIDIGDIVIPEEVIFEKGCVPGTGKYKEMVNVRTALDIKYGSYMNLPKSIRTGYDWMYGDCLGYRDF